MLPSIAKVFGDCGGGQRGLDANQGGLIACGDDNDGAVQCRGAERIVQEIIYFAAPFPDQADHINVRRGITSDHGEADALTNSTGGEDSHTLTDSAGQQPIDGPDAGGQWPGNSRSRGGIGGLAMNGASEGPGGWRTIVEWLAFGVDDAAQ